MIRKELEKKREELKHLKYKVMPLQIKNDVNSLA